MKLLVQSIQGYLLSFLQLQLILTCVSLPFLIAWGLPISLLSCIGNCIFSPFLTLFLLISSLLFFTEILHIPNGLLVYLLNTITSVWTTALSCSPKCALIGFARPSIVVLILIPCIVIYFLFHKNISNTMQRIAYCSLFLVLVGFFLKLDISTSQPRIERITTKNAHITLVIHHGTITLIDSGAIGRQASAESYVEYSLLPTITKLSGALHLDTLVLLRPTKRLFLSIAHLSTMIPIKKIYLVSWENQIEDRAFWRTFWNFKNTIEKNKCDLKRIGPKDHTILISRHSSLILTPIGTFKKYGAKMPQFNAHISAHHTKYSLE